MTEIDLFGRISMTKEELDHEKEGAFWKGAAVACACCLAFATVIVFLIW